MMNDLLSIVIPTYNRPEKLARTIRLLLPQIQKFKVRILIIDNASEKNVDTKNFENELKCGLIKIKQNRTNVGLSANLCKCFEECETEWMWLLSDDDVPDALALDQILADIEKCDSDTCYINYSTSMFQHQRTMSVTGMSEFTDSVTSRYLASNLLFISTGVYNIKHVKKSVFNGYMMCDTLAPHLAILLCTLRNTDLRVLYSPDSIVVYEMPEGGINWSMLKLFCGISSLYNLDGLQQFTGKLLKVFLLQFRWHKFGYSGIILIFSNCEIPVKWWFLQLMKALVLSSAWVRIQCLCMILVLPFASISPLRRMLSRMFSKFDSFQKIKNSV